MWIATDEARYFHAPGSIGGRNGTAIRPITVPVVMMTPKVVRRSDVSDFSSAFHDACIRPASSSSPTMRGSTTISAAGCNFYVFVVQRKRNLLERAPASAQEHGRAVHQHEAKDDH